MGDHLEHAGHLLRLRRVDPADVGVGDIGLDEGGVQGVLRKLQDEVRTVVQRPRHLGHGRGAGVLAPPDPAVGGHGELQLLLVHLAPEHLCGIHDGVHERDVPRATTGVPVELEPIPDLLAGGVRVAVQEGLRRDDKAGGAEPALGPSVFDPGLLDGVKSLRCADPLDGGDHGPLSQTAHLQDAGPDQLPVHDHIARPAMALAAAHLGSRKAELFAQHGREHALSVDDDVPFDSVDDEVLLNHAESLLSYGGVQNATLCPGRNRVRPTVVCGEGRSPPFRMRWGFARSEGRVPPAAPVSKSVGYETQHSCIISSITKCTLSIAHFAPSVGKFFGWPRIIGPRGENPAAAGFLGAIWGRQRIRLPHEICNGS